MNEQIINSLSLGETRRLQRRFSSSAAEMSTIAETDKRTLAEVEKGILNDETVASQSIAIVNDSGNTAASARITTSTSSTENSSQYVADLSRATENSMRDAVGAFRIERCGGNGNNGGEEAQPSRPPSTSVDSTRFTNENLPTNIDIIAEATLVVDDEDDDDEDDHDVNTLGLRWGDGPRLGGAEHETADDAVSTITAPNIPTAKHPQNLQEEAAGDIESGGTGGGRRPLHACTSEGDTDAVVALASTPLVTEDTKDIMTNKPDTPVYEATPVEDGPLAFLQTNSGKRAATFSGTLIVLLSIGLAVMFGIITNATDANKRGGAAPLPEEEQSSYTRVPSQEERDNGVLVFAGGDFCEEREVDSFPQKFIDAFPSPCMSGGILHQAIVDAQRRPHPFCDNIQDLSGVFIPGESQPVTKPNAMICQVTNLTPDVSLINTGAIRGGELPADTPVTEETVNNYLPFSTNKLSYLQVTADDLIKILNNAMSFVTQEDPWNIRHVAAFPFTSGLRYDVSLSAPKGEKVTDIEVLLTSANDSEAETWVSIEQNTQKRYWVVTNDWIAMGGDGYLDGVVPQYIAITDLTYSNELIKHLGNMEGAWVPPKMEEVCIKSIEE